MIIERKVRLTYPVHLLDQPILYDLIKNFEVMTNILQANVTSEQGWLLLAIRGEDETIQQSLAWVSAQGVRVEELNEEGI